MTIGQKITTLRTGMGISQEELSETLGVSRQSVSKWEMDAALPQIDKILQLSEYFAVSTDTLLKEEIALCRPKGERSGGYFGTDGFRAEAGVGLTAQQAFRVGRFLGWYYARPEGGAPSPSYRPRIVIGKDTRRSSYTLEYAIAAGITASGADAYMLHVTTTPSVSYVTRQDGFDAGIMITASHNPYYDNGIKVLGPYGEKLDDETTAKIEAYLDGDLASLGIEGEDLPLAQRARIGCIHDHVAGRNRYIGYLISLASHSYKELRIGLDTANGASWSIAPAVFSALGAKLYVIGGEPDGLNVNEGCGATRPERLAALVKEKHLDLGFAFDGDADRCIAVDGNGRVVDGDAILYILAKRLSARGMLKDGTVVATVMSNSGFVKSLEQIGLRVAETAVGDRFVYERMQKEGYDLGGEQSGHIILRKYATTGDGLLTAIMLTEEVLDSKKSLATLAEPVKYYPQYTKNVRVTSKSATVADAGVQRALCAARERLSGEGRILLRESGTEPVVRIMVESKTDELCRALADEVANAIREGGLSLG